MSVMEVRAVSDQVISRMNDRRFSRLEVESLFIYCKQLSALYTNNFRA